MYTYWKRFIWALHASSQYKSEDRRSSPVYHLSLKICQGSLTIQRVFRKYVAQSVFHAQFFVTEYWSWLQVLVSGTGATPKASQTQPYTINSANIQPTQSKDLCNLVQAVEQRLKSMQGSL